MSEIWDIFGRDIGHKSPRPYCPAVIGFAASLVEEIKEIKEIFIPLGETLSALSAISAGLLESRAESFYCPAEMKEIKEIQVSDVALGRPSASKLQGQELQKVK